MEGKASDIVKRAMENGFEEAVASVHSSRSVYLKVTNSKVDSIVDKHDESAVLYVTSKNRIVVINIDDLSDSTVVAKIKEARNATKYVLAKDDYFGIAEGPFKYRSRPDADRLIKDSSNDKLADIAYTAINEATANGASNTAGMLHTYYGEHDLATSRDVQAESTSTNARFTLRTFSDFGSYQDVHVSSRLSGLSPMQLGQQSADMSRSMRDTGRIKTGTYDIIYMPASGGSLLSDITEYALISNIETGSIFTDKLGQKVASKDMTIYDSGDNMDVPGSLPYDQEGYPTQTTKVIDNGVLKNYLHNCSTARKYKTKSTGNAGLVDPDTNTMVFDHKKKVKDIDALIKKVKKGVIVTNNWYTRFSNFVTGDFSTMPRDLAIYVENGERKFSIRQGSVASMIGIRVTDNFSRMINSVDSTTKDAVQATSWDADGSIYVTPPILVRDAKVTAI